MVGSVAFDRGAKGEFGALPNDQAPFPGPGSRLSQNQGAQVGTPGRLQFAYRGQRQH